MKIHGIPIGTDAIQMPNFKIGMKNLFALKLPLSSKKTENVAV